jgi:hypothetical protein
MDICGFPEEKTDPSRVTSDGSFFFPFNGLHALARRGTKVYSFDSAAGTWEMVFLQKWLGGAPKEGCGI